MHSIPYRTKQRIRKGLKAALIVLGVLALLDALAIFYLGRYVVYGEDGAHIVLDRSTARSVDDSELLREPERQTPEVSIVYENPGANSGSAELITGYYIDIAMLQHPEKVMEALQALDGPCTVMIDLKSSSGSFYYSTSIAGAVTADSIDVTEVDQIISYLRTNGFTMIARIEAFRDTEFALAHIPSGIATPSGVLWMDRSGYYWLDPEDSLVQEYLRQIVNELAAKGFSEVVLNDFYFPESGQIRYTSEKSRSELMSDTAQSLVEYFRTTKITISFGDPSHDFVLTEPTSHVYLSGVAGSGVGSAISGYNRLASAQEQLVFLTGSRDTRFESCNVLRPLL